MYEIPKIKEFDIIDYAGLLAYLYSPESNTIHCTRRLSPQCSLNLIRQIIQGNSVEELNVNQDAAFCPFCSHG